MSVVLASLIPLLSMALGYIACWTWERRRTRNTPVYIWPLDGPRRQQEREGLAWAEDAYRHKRHKTPGLQAQWDSGLGREFPLNHCN